jgi:hypothetical protein
LEFASIVARHVSGKAAAMRLSILAAILWACLWQPARAAAQSLDGTPLSAPKPQQVLLLVQLHLEKPNTRVLVYAEPRRGDTSEPGEPHLIYSCATDCQLYVAPGAYQLRLEEGGGKYSVKSIEINAPKSISLGPLDRKAANAGLTLGITGTVAAGAGLIMLGWAAMSQMGENQPSWEPTVAQVGLVGLVAGAVATPIGWRMFAANRKMKLEERDLLTQQSAPLIVVAVLPTPGGLSMGLSATF